MANYPNFYNPNQGIMNQLLRQKDNVENMIQQYSQMPNQIPVQNIINTNSGLEFEAKILKDDEELENIFINRRTMFLDKKNKKVVIKETDGTISEQYEIIVPLDEKDRKIQDLENRLKEMEDKFNGKYAEPIRANDGQHKSDTDANRNVELESKTDAKSIQKSTK